MLRWLTGATKSNEKSEKGPNCNSFAGFLAVFNKKRDREIKLYVLTRFLFETDHPEAFLRVLSEALEAGAEPGESMMKAFETVKKPVSSQGSDRQTRNPYASASAPLTARPARST